MPINDNFIDELVSRLNIVDVVSKYVGLQKRGGRFWGLCPFHSEKTASFSVSEDTQQFYCFGCHAGGGVIGFIEKIENLEFRDAVAFLARLAGMQMPADDGAGELHRRNRERLLELCRAAAKFFHERFMSDEGLPAREYLSKRQVSPGVARRFGIGYSPQGWSGLLDAMKALGYSENDLIAAGLAVKGERGAYDRFRNRLMFPIIDVNGSVIAFGGRVLDDSLPKYLNSPETEIYHKSDCLFALNIARKSTNRRYILAEGYMDVVALHQGGFDTAVASLGTALTERQADMLKKRADEVVVAYDADEAGQKAVARALEIFKRKDLKAVVLKVPNAKDPDEFIKKFGREAFETLLNGSKPSLDYRLEAVAKKYNLDDEDQTVEFVRDAAGLASTYFGAERELLRNKISKLSGISETAVGQEIDKRASGNARREKSEERRVNINPVSALREKGKYKNVASANAIKGIIAIIARFPELFPRIEGRIDREWMNGEGCLGELYDALTERIKSGVRINIDLLRNDCGAETADTFAEITSTVPISENYPRALDDYITKLDNENRPRESLGDIIAGKKKNTYSQDY